MSKEYQPLNHPSADQPSSPKYLFFVALTTVISSFMFGFHGAVMNSPQNVISKCFIDHKTPSNTTLETNSMGMPLCIPMSTGTWSIVVSIFAVGALFGSILGGVLVAKIGRKYSLVTTNLLLIIGSFMIAFSETSAVLITGRFIVGFAIGYSAVTVTLYIVEISPPKYRGTLGSLPQFFNGIGLVVSGILGMLLSTLYTWRTIFLLSLIPPVLQCFLLLACPESPDFLKLNNRQQEYQIACRKLGLPADNTAKESPKIDEKTLSVSQLLSLATLKRSLEIAIMLQIIQQFIGINAVVFYSTSIFSAIYPDNAPLATVLLCVVNVIMTGVSVSLMDKSGRKTLLLYSLYGIAGSLSLLIIAFVSNSTFLVLTSLISFMASFALGTGPIPWLMMGELFPPIASSAAVSIGCSINWTGTMIVGFSFPFIQEGLGNFAFAPFAIVAYFSIFYAKRRVLETKGKSVQELISLLNS